MMSDERPKGCADRVAALERRAVNAEQEAEKWRAESLRQTEARVQAVHHARAEERERCESIEFIQAAIDGSLVERWPDVDIDAMYDAFRAGWNAHVAAIRALEDE